MIGLQRAGCHPRSCDTTGMSKSRAASPPRADADTASTYARRDGLLSHPGAGEPLDEWATGCRNLALRATPLTRGKGFRPTLHSSNLRGGVPIGPRDPDERPGHKKKRTGGLQPKKHRRENTPAVHDCRAVMSKPRAPRDPPDGGQGIPTYRHRHVPPRADEDTEA